MFVVAVEAIKDGLDFPVERAVLSLQGRILVDDEERVL